MNHSIKQSATPNGQRFNMPSVSAPTAVSTADGIRRSELSRLEQRVSAVRAEMSAQANEGGCGGVGGGWGN